MSQRQNTTEKTSDKSSHHSSKDRLRDTSPSSTRITIKQNVPSTSKKGPQNTKRSVDPNDISITRRFGEGSKPLFAREDVRVNRSPSKHTDSKCRSESESSSQSSDSGVSTYRKRNQRDNRKRSRSDDRSNKRNDFKSSSSKERHQAGHSSRRGKSYSPKRKRSPEKLPYFVDEKREEDRIRQKYGESSSRSRRERSPSRSRHRIGYRSHSRDRRRSPSRNRRRRSRSPSRYRNDRLAPIPVQPPFFVPHYIEYFPPPPWGAPYPRPFMIRPAPFPAPYPAMMPPCYGYIPRPPPPPQWHGRFSRPNRPNRPRNY